MVKTDREGDKNSWGHRTQQYDEIWQSLDRLFSVICAFAVGEYVTEEHAYLRTDTVKQCVYVSSACFGNEAIFISIERLCDLKHGF